MSSSDSCQIKKAAPIKLVFIITGLAANGAETMLLKLLERIDRNRFIPQVVSLTTLGEIGPRIKSLGISVEALGISNPFTFLPKFIHLVKHIKKISPDVVHTWMYHADLIGGVAARLAGNSAVAWGIVHSNLNPTVNKRGTLAVVRACALLSKWLPLRIISCSTIAQKIHTEYGYVNDKFVVLPLGFDLSLFRPDGDARISVRLEFGLSPNTPVIGLVGRFDPQKNHLGFIRACSIIHKVRTDVHFLLVGSGVDEDNMSLKSAIKDNGLTKVVHLAGMRRDMPKIMAAIDFLASSSVGEGFPNVLGEAMACGIPCAVTNVGDSAFVVGETGFVVESGDMQGLAKSLLNFLDMEQNELSRRKEMARIRIENNFELGSVVRRYEIFYETLLGVSGKGNQ
jgi:glycosyltransferase involved in cell wall biosynthesis